MLALTMFVKKHCPWLVTGFSKFQNTLNILKSLSQSFKFIVFMLERAHNES